MNTLSTRPLPRRASRGGRYLAMPLAVLLVLSIAACASLAPGADPIVVRTEQAMEASLAVYDAGMTWCRANPQHLTPAAAAVAETIRTAFPPAYRSTDSALQLYKAGKGGDVMAASDEMQRLASQLLLLIRLAGGPDLTGGAK